MLEFEIQSLVAYVLRRRQVMILFLANIMLVNENGQV